MRTTKTPLLLALSLLIVSRTAGKGQHQSGSAADDPTLRGDAFLPSTHTHRHVNTMHARTHYIDFGLSTYSSLYKMKDK